MAVTINGELCTACGVCADTCPVEAIKIEATAVVNEDECIECGACVSDCPSEAIKLPE